MKFFYRGTKKSNEPDVASGCLLIIAFAAIIYLLTLLEDLDDWKEYGWQVALALFIGGSFLVSVFAKRGKLTSKHVVIENDYLKMEKVGVPLETLTMDVYLKGEEFIRYHLRDSEGKVAIYSVLKDDLYEYFAEAFPEAIKRYQEHSHKHEGPYISVLAEGQSLYYNLESGKYTITNQSGNEISFLPDIYAYDGKYKKGVPLGKKK